MNWLSLSDEISLATKAARDALEQISTAQEWNAAEFKELTKAMDDLIADPPLDVGSQFLETYTPDIEPPDLNNESLWPKKFIDGLMKGKPHLKMPAPEVVSLNWKLNKEDLDLLSTEIVTSTEPKFPEEHTMTDLQKLQAKVAFHCEQCDRIINNVVCFGEYKGILRVRVMCHNSSQMMEVKTIDLAAATAASPLVVPTFQSKPKFDKNMPNVRFYCQACDQLTAQFSYQFVPNMEQHCFTIICCGRICAGKSHARIFRANSLHDFHIFDHTTTPVILPINGNMNVTRVAKMASQKVVPIAVPPPLRKLRFEE